MGRIKYLLDTNILSEPVKASPNPNVLNQLKQHDGSVCTAVTVWHELCFGCEQLLESKRKNQLQSYVHLLLQNGLVILHYDRQAAEWFACERARLTKQGQSPSYADGEIAAIAATHELTLVTRNIRDFECFQGLKLQDWFQPGDLLFKADR